MHLEERDGHQYIETEICERKQRRVDGAEQGSPAQRSLALRIREIRFRHHSMHLGYSVNIKTDIPFALTQFALRLGSAD